jgi:hypothetical protein
MTRSPETTQHYTPHATLAAIGIKIRSLKLFDTIKEHVHIRGCQMNCVNEFPSSDGTLPSKMIEKAFIA